MNILSAQTRRHKKSSNTHTYATDPRIFGNQWTEKIVLWYPEPIPSWYELSYDVFLSYIPKSVQLFCTLTDAIKIPIHRKTSSALSHGSATWDTQPGCGVWGVGAWGCGGVGVLEWGLGNGPGWGWGGMVGMWGWMNCVYQLHTKQWTPAHFP